jgi:hypothetical protein
MKRRDGGAAKKRGAANAAPAAAWGWLPSKRNISWLAGCNVVMAAA